MMKKLFAILAFLAAFTLMCAPPLPAQKGQKPPKGQPGGQPETKEHVQELIRMLEQKTGKALSDDQKTKICEADRVSRDGIKSARRLFVSKLATVTKLPADQLKTLAPRGGMLDGKSEQIMVEKLEQAMGRKLAIPELEQVRLAFNELANATIQSKDSFAQTVATITGLPVNEIKALSPAKGE